MHRSIFHAAQTLDLGKSGFWKTEAHSYQQRLGDVYNKLRTRRVQNMGGEFPGRQLEKLRNRLEEVLPCLCMILHITVLEG